MSCRRYKRQDGFGPLKQRLRLESPREGKAVGSSGSIAPAPSHLVAGLIQAVRRADVGQQTHRPMNIDQAPSDSRPGGFAKWSLIIRRFAKEAATFTPKETIAPECKVVQTSALKTRLRAWADRYKDVLKEGR